MDRTSVMRQPEGISKESQRTSKVNGQRQSVILIKARVRSEGTIINARRESSGEAHGG